MKILVVSGSSGGHIFPALSFLDTLKNRDKHIETLLVLPKKNKLGRLQAGGYNVKYISISNIKLRPNLKNFFALVDFLKAFFESIFLLIFFRPDTVVGFGSLASVPLVLSAWAFRVKTLIHEQNVIPGRANKLLAGFSDRIAVSFPESWRSFKGLQRKVVFTGNPLRGQLKKHEKEKSLDFFGLSGNKFTILVTGGSQGSQRINLFFPKALLKIADRNNLQVIHLAGANDAAFLRDKYKELNIKNSILTFLESMEYAYSACDLVISRAGATTIAELILFALPAIIIPYPFAYKHQTANARVLADCGAATVIEDRELESGILADTLSMLFNQPDKLNKMRLAYSGIERPPAGELLVDAVLSLAAG